MRRLTVILFILAVAAMGFMFGILIISTVAPQRTDATIDDFGLNNTVIFMAISATETAKAWTVTLSPTLSSTATISK